MYRKQIVAQLREEHKILFFVVKVELHSLYEIDERVQSSPTWAYNIYLYY
jgi:hypothetical protein